MIPRSYTLSASDVRGVFKAPDRVSSSPYFKVLSKGGGDRPRLGVVVPRSVAGKAVERNRIRRRIFAAVREIYTNLPSGRYVILARSAASYAPRNTLTKAVKDLTDQRAFRRVSRHRKQRSDLRE